MTQTRYGIGEQERLDATIDDCVEQWLMDRMDSVGLSNVGPVVTVIHYCQDEPLLELWTTAGGGSGPLERLLEDLDENFGDPDDYSPVEPSEYMKLAESYFVSVVMAEYDRMGGFWKCVPNGETTTVNVQAWVDSHWGMDKLPR